MMKPLKKETVNYLVEMYKDRCISKQDGEERAIKEATAILRETYGEDEQAINTWLRYLAQVNEIGY
jgi:hypothetical protein